jgi:hypothetical protein
MVRNKNGKKKMTKHGKLPNYGTGTPRLDLALPEEW